MKSASSSAHGPPYASSSSVTYASPSPRAPSRWRRSPREPTRPARRRRPRVQAAQRSAKRPRVRQIAGTAVRDVLPHGHPETVEQVRPGRHQPRRRDGQRALRQERPHRDLTREPALDGVMKGRRRRHHARDGRRRLQVDEHVAGPRQQDRVLTRQAVCPRDGAGGSKRTKLCHGAHQDPRSGHADVACAGPAPEPDSISSAVSRRLNPRSGRWGTVPHLPDARIARPTGWSSRG
jgi:hypothetical protein